MKINVKKYKVLYIGITNDGVHCLMNGQQLYAVNKENDFGVDLKTCLLLFILPLCSSNLILLLNLFLLLA